MSYQDRNNQRTGKCRSMTCEAELLWAETPKGKRIPLDPRPTETGNIALQARPGRPLDLAITLDKEHLAVARAKGDALYTSHFATCPARKVFKR